MKKIFQSLTFRIVLLAIVVCVFVFVYFLFTGTTDVEENKLLIVEPTELNLNVHYTENIKLFLYDSNNEKKLDVTDKADWKSSNKNIVTVGNNSVKGQARGIGEGETQITTVYNNQTVIIPVKIESSKLVVECYPLIFDKDGSQTEPSQNKTAESEANIGDRIRWQITYIKIGVPNYFYEWTGTDGLESNEAIVDIVYDTLGVKQAKIFTEDTVGLTAEAECQVQIVK